MNLRRLRILSLALLAGSVLSTGCMKRADYSMSMAEMPMEDSATLQAEFGYDPLASPVAGGSAGGMAPAAPPQPNYDESYGGDMDLEMEEGARMAAVETVAMMDSADSGYEGGVLGRAFERAADKRQTRRAEKKMKTAAPGPARPDGPTPTKNEPTDIALEKPEDPGAAVAKDADDDEPEDHGRQIIYTAAMIVAVHDVVDATERAEKLPDAFGGYVHQRAEGTLVLKVPAKNLRKAMDALAAYGIVQARQLQAQDVTAEYTDLESRIRVLRNTQEQLLELLEKAKTVEETLRVQQALDQVTMQLETALGRMRQMADAISFSTLTIRFQQRSPEHHLPSSNDPFRWVDQLGVESTEWR